MNPHVESRLHKEAMRLMRARPGMNYAEAESAAREVVEYDKAIRRADPGYMTYAMHDGIAGPFFADDVVSHYQHASIDQPGRGGIDVLVRMVQDRRGLDYGTARQVVLESLAR